ncbi:MAG: A/G-specific adenine glycosylase [Alphaproteobacteria bacterium]|nr:A/G-specific adenine glycosylase [Alphaproteobacteria bacterium]
MSSQDKTAYSPTSVASDMIDWYDTHRRDLPWRAHPGQPSDPYHIWLSEIMLQQTTVATVKSYFAKFLSLWPDITAMADAPLEDILQAWAGLGYYARARNLHKCANVIMHQYNGCFPETEAELLTLPGIGPYTAAAIASIAFQQRAVVVDGNIERVMARLHKSEAQLPRDKKEIYRLAELETPDNRCGDYAQSLMDLGATICTPKSPKCIICPIQIHCRAGTTAEEYPKKAPKKEKPTRIGNCIYLTTQDGYTLLERRPEKGLLGKMPGLAGGDWTTDNEPKPEYPLALAGLIDSAQGLNHLGEIKHTFTHFHLFLNVFEIEIPNLTEIPDNYYWVESQTIKEAGLPTVFKKALSLATKDK